MRLGLVALYHRLELEERQQALAEVRVGTETLASVPPETHPGIWDTGNGPRVEAFFRLLRGGGDIPGLFRRFQDRETRARLLRYLAQEYDGLPDQAEAILKALSFRDLINLMAYLPDELDEWDRLIRADLGRRIWQKGDGSESSRGAEVAMAACLRRWAEEEPEVAELIDKPPGEDYFNLSLVRLSFTRLLTQAIQQEIHSASLSQQTFFPRLVSALFWFPPLLARYAFLAFPYQSEPALDCEAFASFLENLKTSSSAADVGEVLERLLGRLCALPEPTDWQQLLCALIALQQVGARCAGGDWSSCRRDGLVALERAVAAGYDFTLAEAPIMTELVEGLRSMLPRQPLAPDHEPLEERTKAIERARRQLDKPTREVRPRARTHSWWPYVDGLLSRTRKTAHLFLNQEQIHVLRQVRPRLSLLDQHRDNNNHLDLRLRMTGEGSRHLDDVTILLNAGDPSGLLPPGRLEKRLGVLTYPGRFPAKDLDLSGYLRPGQDSVRIAVTVRDGTGYRLQEDWSFPVPEPVSRESGTLTLPDALPRAYEGYRQTLFAAKEPVTLAVFDKDLGRDALLAAWDSQFPGRRSDLDQVTRDTGEGRRYGERRLDLPLIESAIADTLERVPRASHQAPLLIAPVDEFVQQLLDGEAPHLLEAWWSKLRERARRREAPPWLVLVSSAHACRLRLLGLDPILEYPAHYLLESSEELRALVMREAGLGESEAIRCIERLGRDLRLVLGWLRHLKKSPEERDLESYLASKSVQETLRSELRALSAFDLINTLLGAETETTLKFGEVVPGQVAAGDYDSSTRKGTLKRLRSRHEAFTAEDLDRLRSDQRPPAHVRIQGFGIQGTPEARRSRLLAVAQYRRPEDREASFRRLASRGIGIWHGGIFRTASPYRETIRALYNQYGDLPPEERDRGIFTRLLGEGYSPAEAIAPLEVAQIPEDHLERLMPAASKRDRQCLRRLARLWGTPPQKRREQELAAVLGNLYAPEIVQRIGPRDCNAPLAELDLPGFAVRRSLSSYPHSYLFWLKADDPDPRTLLGNALDRIMACRKEEKDSTPGHMPRILLLGPGAEGLPIDPTRVAVLPLSAFCTVSGIQRKARTQLRLSSFSPFQTSGPCPLGVLCFRAVTPSWTISGPASAGPTSWWWGASYR